MVHIWTTNYLPGLFLSCMIPDLLLLNQSTLSNSYPTTTFRPSINNWSQGRLNQKSYVIISSSAGSSKIHICNVQSLCSLRPSLHCKVLWPPRQRYNIFILNSSRCLKLITSNLSNSIGDLRSSQRPPKFALVLGWTGLDLGTRRFMRLRNRGI